ncbi:hypothetical protein QE152_g30838 [Popillia japonica]|uniref:Uncharacterized protein n=1 Tax=Popillia japonica TaxID=7064 RepID=A0AAW1JD89_POPJA
MRNCDPVFSNLREWLMSSGIAGKHKQWECECRHSIVAISLYRVVILSDGFDDEHSDDVSHLPRAVMCQPCEIVPPNDDEFQPDDIMQLSEGKEGKSTVKDLSQKSVWVNNPKKLPDNAIVTIYNPLPCSAELTNLSTRNSFLSFFNEDLMNFIVAKNSSKEKHFGVMGDVVMVLLEQGDVPKNEGHTVYFEESLERCCERNIRIFQH